jgi:LAO/AO transport system kinase
MEIADIFVVNKADRDGADHMVQSVAANLSLQTFAPGEWRPPILKTEAPTGAGIAELWQMIGTYRDQSPDRRRVRQHARQESRLRELLTQRFLESVQHSLAPGEFDAAVAAITERRMDPYAAAAALMTKVQLR